MADGFWHHFAMPKQLFCCSSMMPHLRRDMPLQLDAAVRTGVHMA
jgi:hypothetical protein